MGLTGNKSSSGYCSPGIDCQIVRLSAPTEAGLLKKKKCRQKGEINPDRITAVVFQRRNACVLLPPSSPFFLFSMFPR